MNEPTVMMIDAGVRVDPIDAASSWRTAKRAAAALTTFGGARSGLQTDEYIVAMAEQWLSVGLRTAWIARNVVGRTVDLDDVHAWLSVALGRLPVDVSMMLSEAARSDRRSGRVAATVALGEWASIPERSHHPKMLAFTTLLSRRCLTIVPRPGIGEAEWFAAAYLAVTFGGRSGSASTHLRLDEVEGRWVVDRSWRDRTPRGTVTV